jgi:phage N-6-adenine-methyltransferase
MEASLERPDWWSSDHWATPWPIVRALEAEFGEFNLDPCCRKENAKARRFYTLENNGLAQQWFGRVFMNPPYSKPGPWLEKAIMETQPGHALIVVALLPVRTDTRWFHTLVKDRAEVRFIQGRIKWIGWQGTPIPQPKDPNMLAIYRCPVNSAAV